jgi:meso-butanediol dehydrogenase/(S,S)-butanediol dehydrogenase/diacetyl reductase
MSLRDKIALITGATSGIGAACVREFVRCGAKVMIAGRDENRAAALRDEARAGGADADTVIGDVRERVWCDAAVAATVQRFGRIDVLVNSAGIIHRADALGTSDEAWDETMAVNVDGVFFLCRAAIRAMRLTGGGAIVNVASDWGLVGGKGHVAYCASKGAVVNLTRALAIDHAADNIRVNVICPGEVRTPMLESGLAKRGFGVAEGLAALGKTVPLGRVSDPEEQARCIRFLASDDAGYMTGAVLSVDGGNTAR